jgi:hypothetical protein
LLLRNAVDAAADRDCVNIDLDYVPVRKQRRKILSRILVAIDDKSRYHDSPVGDIKVDIGIRKDFVLAIGLVRLFEYYNF